MNALFRLWISIQQELFPRLEEVLEPLSEREKEFVRIAELAEVDKHMGPYRWIGNGRKPKDRKGMALSLIAKAVWNFPTTEALISYLEASRNLRRLCGWERAEEIPSGSTFSRAFEEFSLGQLPQIAHEAMVKKQLGEKLVGHVSRDSTAVEGREKPERKESAAKSSKPSRKRGRPKKGESAAAPTPKRLEVQPGRGLTENLADLPQHCDVGMKRDSKGDGPLDVWGDCLNRQPALSVAGVKGRKVHTNLAPGQAAEKQEGGLYSNDGSAEHRERIPGQSGPLSSYVCNWL